MTAPPVPVIVVPEYLPSADKAGSRVIELFSAKAKSPIKLVAVIVKAPAAQLPLNPLVPSANKYCV